MPVAAVSTPLLLRLLPRSAARSSALTLTRLLSSTGAYGEGMTVTSAMKGLAPTVKTMLSEVVAGNFANYGGKIDTLGLVSDNPEDNYVQLPMSSTQFADGKFTVDDYKALVADMFAGKTTVSNDTTKAASDFATVITVDDQGAIK